MSFGNPWGLLGLLSIPTILAIHFYHRRFPPLQIAGLHLWSSEQQVRTPGRRRDRLPITPSLLLELLAAFLLSFILSDPQIEDQSQATHLVVVLDNSASMSSNLDGATSLKNMATQLLAQRATELDRGSVITLITTGHRPEMLAGPAIPWEDALVGLNDWNPQSPRHEFQPAWDLGAQLAGETGQLLFLTDHLHPKTVPIPASMETDHIPPKAVPIPASMEIVSVGRKLSNVAISAARWTFDATSGEGNLFLRVRNHGKTTAQVTLTATTDTQAVFQESNITLQAGQEIPFETNIPGGLGKLSLELHSSGDGLDVDNSIVLIEPKVRMLTVAVTFPKDDLALNAIQKVLKNLPDIQLGKPEIAHLVIGPADQPPTERRDLWWLGVGPLSRSESEIKKSKDVAGPFLLDKRHPLLDGVVLGGVVWGGIQPIQQEVSPLISVGKTPLLARLKNTLATSYLLNIDLARTNLTESPDWPILLSNLCELRRESLPGLRRWNYRLNEDIRFRVAEPATEAIEENESDLTLVHNGNSRPLAQTSIVEIPPLNEPGVYQVKQGENVVGEFAVNFFDSEESDISGLLPGIHQPDTPLQSQTTGIDQIYSWLIMLGILIILVTLLADWRVLKPTPISSPIGRKSSL